MLAQLQTLAHRLGFREVSNTNTLVEVEASLKITTEGAQRATDDFLAAIQDFETELAKRSRYDQRQ